MRRCRRNAATARGAGSAVSAFIVMEGTDGAGTTTQGDLLAAALQRAGVEVVRTRQPSELPVGALLRQALRGGWQAAPGAVEVALLFAADRVNHVREVITPALARGAWVVCDRYLGSSLAFQVVDGAGALDPAWILAINAHTRRPDLTLWCDLEVSEAIARIDARGLPRERFERAATLAAVRGRYQQLAADPPPALGPIARVDATPAPHEVHASVLTALRAALGAARLPEALR